MPASRRIPRDALTLVVLSLLGLGPAVLGTAKPAHADEGDVRVRIGGLSSSLYAGRNGDSFSIRMENRSQQDLSNLRRVIVVQLPGLDASQVDLSVRRFGTLAKSSPGPGEVRFEDGIRLAPRRDRGDEVNSSFTIRFGQQTPDGQVLITVYAIHNDQILGSAREDVRVRGGQPFVTPTPSASVTTAASTEPAAPPSGVVTAVKGPPADGLASVDMGVPPVLYVLGAVLVALGGLILWLLLRRPKPAAEYQPAHYYPGETAEVRPPNLGYPDRPAPPAAPLNPTMIMPAIQDPRDPPPADPWAPTRRS